MVAIKITANRQDEEPDRIVRLTRLRDVLQAKRVSTIIGLHDHKGVLYVNWASQPTASELGQVIMAWHSENEPLTNHAVNGKPFLWDVGGDNPFDGQDFP